MDVILLALMFAVVVQAQPAINPQPQLQQQTDAPTPGGGGGSTRSTTSTPAPFNAEAFGTLLFDGGGVAMSKVADGMDSMLETYWGIPDSFGWSRSPSNTVDEPKAAQLNDQLVFLIPGLVLAGMALVLLVNAASVLFGREPNPMMAVGSLVLVGVAGLAAANNRWLQRWPIDLVGALLNAISGTTLREFARPGLGVADGVAPFLAAFHAIIYAIALGFLTIVLFVEGAWCILLGAGGAIWLVGSVLPFFGGSCQFILRRWAGSLFSPVLVYMALRLAAPALSDFGSGHPRLMTQALSIVFVALAWQVPGFVVGAIAVSLPGLSSLYYAGRLIGAGRVSERMIPRGGGSGSAGSGVATWRPTPASGLPCNGWAATDKRAWA